MWSNGWDRRSARSTAATSCCSSDGTDAPELRRSFCSMFTSGCLAEFQPAPDFAERRDELVHHFRAVRRAGREAQALGAAADRRVIDWLHVEPVLGEQDIADFLRLDRAADE